MADLLTAPIWAFLYLIATIEWQVVRGLILLVVLIDQLSTLIVTSIFTDIWKGFAGDLRNIYLPLIFNVVVLILGITYVLAAYVKIRVVDWKKATAWFLGALMFYSMGPQLFQKAEVFRRRLGGMMYAIVLADPGNCAARIPDVMGNLLHDFQPSDASEATFDEQNQVCLTPQFDDPEYTIWDEEAEAALGNFVPQDKGIDSLDVMMAYLKVDDWEVLQFNPLPSKFEAFFFPQLATAENPPTIFDAEFWEPPNGDRLTRPLRGVLRLVTSWYLFLFAIGEKGINLVLSVEAVIIAITLAYALLLSFFEQTESFALGIIKSWVKLLRTTMYVTLLQALAVFLVLLGGGIPIPQFFFGMVTLGQIFQLTAAILVIKSLGDLVMSTPLVGNIVQDTGQTFQMVADIGMQAGMAAATGGASALGSLAGAAGAAGSAAGAMGKGGSSGAMGGADMLLKPGMDKPAHSWMSGTLPTSASAGAGGAEARFSHDQIQQFASAVSQAMSSLKGAEGVTPEKASSAFSDALNAGGPVIGSQRLAPQFGQAISGYMKQGLTPEQGRARVTDSMLSSSLGPSQSTPSFDRGLLGGKRSSSPVPSPPAPPKKSG